MYTVHVHCPFPAAAIHIDRVSAFYGCLVELSEGKQGTVMSGCKTVSKQLLWRPRIEKTL